MIVFDLACADGHAFEGWFASSDEFARQQAAGLVACPACGSVEVGKAAMAPRLARKGNQLPAVAKPQAVATMPPQARAMLHAMAKLQAEALKCSIWVGENFATDARAMHDGIAEHAPIHGQASAEEARALVEEGVEIMPILFPYAPPGEVN